MPVVGVAANGLLRVDPTAFVLLGLTVTNGVANPLLPVAVPSSPSATFRSSTVTWVPSWVIA